MNEAIIKNIFADIPDILGEEHFQNIIEQNNFYLERIVSDGQVTPPNFWYDQERNEFVLLLSGSAQLIYDDGKVFNLKIGDYIIIPAHQKHRIEKTSKNEKTVWLALHFE